MRRLAFAIALACVLSGVARAGEIPSTGATAPPPPTSVVTAGEISITGETAPETSVLTIILAILDIVP
jgi:hypothetical protein